MLSFQLVFHAALEADDGKRGSGCVNRLGQSDDDLGSSGKRRTAISALYERYKASN
ncbi:MAG: hypothetical protein ACJ8BW_14235 [Ktedonobacteraceae bacterium]